MIKDILIHYPKDGVTYMKAQCGAHSVSSCDIIKMVTCPDCLKLIAEGCKQFKWSDYELS